MRPLPGLASVPLWTELEICSWEDGRARLLWLLPITAAERNLKASHGLEALETRFDEEAILFWEPGRRSVV